MSNKKSFCIKCQKEVGNEVELCKCGGHNFAFGDLKIVNNKIVCKCGNAIFKRGGHFDFTDRATTTMTCAKCGNVCGSEYYRTEDDLMYWGDV